MNQHKINPPVSLRHMVIWSLITILLLAGCNRNEPTPTPAPTPAPIEAQVGTVGRIGQPAPGEASQATPVPAQGTATPPTPTPLSGRVVLWHSWAQSNGDALAAVLEQLRAAQPGLQVDTLFVAPDDLVASYADAVAAGSGPDLVLAPNWWLSDLVAANALLDLDGLVGSEIDAAYWPAAIVSMRHNGALYGLPLTYNLVALFVNSSLVPPEGIPTDTATMLAAAQATPTSGVALYATLFHTYWGFPAYGAQLLDAQGRVTLDQNSGAADYLAWLVAINSTPGSYVNSDYGMLLDRFKKAELAYLVDGPWAIADLQSALGTSLAVAPLPSGPTAPAQPWLYSDGIFINPVISAEQQTLAFQVATFFSSDQAGSTLARVGSLLPAARNADLSSMPLLQGFATQAATAAAMPTTPEMNHVWTYGGDLLIKALAGVGEPSIIVVETTTLINEANGK